MSDLEIIHPDGGRDLPALNPQAQEFVYGRTEHRVNYRARTGAEETVVCVNLLDEGETNSGRREIQGKQVESEPRCQE
jgi:hypothetical protein